MDDELALEILQGRHVAARVCDQIVDGDPAHRAHRLRVGHHLRHARMAIQVVLDPLEDAHRGTAVRCRIFRLVKPHLGDHEALLVEACHGMVAAELVEGDAAVGGRPARALAPNTAHLPRPPLVHEDEAIGRVEVVVIGDHHAVLLEEAHRRARRRRGDGEGRREPESAQGHEVAAESGDGSGSAHLIGNTIRLCRPPCQRECMPRILGIG